MAAGLNREASLLNLNAEFERNGQVFFILVFHIKYNVWLLTCFPGTLTFRFGQTPEGLANLLRTAERKPSETAEQMRHRIYSRLYGVMLVSDYFLNVNSLLLKVALCLSFCLFLVPSFSLMVVAQYNMVGKKQRINVQCSKSHQHK